MTSQKIKVAILFGGASNEYEISLRSAAAVCRHLDDRFEPILIGITRTGEWFLFRGDLAALESDTWHTDPAKIAPLSLALAPRGGFLTPSGESVRPDVILPIVHGQTCEDGKLQGLLDHSGIAYVGCGCEASVLGMDKAVTKMIAESVGVPVAAWILCSASEGYPEIDSDVQRVEKHFARYPLFVKAVNSGSSLGAYRADDRESLRQALLDASAVDSKILVEEFITGREVETAVLSQNGTLTVFAPGEIEPCADFYDYDTKYKNDSARYYIPARLSPEKLEEVRTYAALIFRAIGARHLSRVDFFATEDGRIIFNEINTLPGFTSISMYPKMAEAGGLPLTDLITALILEALS